MKVRSTLLVIAVLGAGMLATRIASASPDPDYREQLFRLKTMSLWTAARMPWCRVGHPSAPRAHSIRRNAQFAGTTGDNVQGTLPDGGQIAIITTYFGGPMSAGMTQSVGTVAAGTAYTLTVAVGTRADLQSGAWEIALLAGSTVLASDSANSGPAGGTFVDHLAIAGPLLPSDPSVGQSLIIRITGSNASGNVATAQDAFDNVRLTAEVPEPASVGLFGVALAVAGCRRQRLCGI
jgi:hypothetical protein